MKGDSIIYLPCYKLQDTNQELAIINVGHRWIKPKDFKVAHVEGPQYCCVAKFVPIQVAVDMLRFKLGNPSAPVPRYELQRLCKLSLDLSFPYKAMDILTTLDAYMQSISYSYNIPRTSQLGWHKIVIKGGKTL